MIRRWVVTRTPKPAATTSFSRWWDKASQTAGSRSDNMKALINSRYWDPVQRAGDQ